MTTDATARTQRAKEKQADSLSQLNLLNNLSSRLDALEEWRGQQAKLLEEHRQESERIWQKLRTMLDQVEAGKAKAADLTKLAEEVADHDERLLLLERARLSLAQGKVAEFNASNSEQGARDANDEDLFAQQIEELEEARYSG